uniref:Uncharacterized protein n=1 Tax=Anopheles quadriannulatus TaxID=34691 RepID=A0A182XRI1_ANOQN
MMLRDGTSFDCSQNVATSRIVRRKPKPNTSIVPFLLAELAIRISNTVVLKI